MTSLSNMLAKGLQQIDHLTICKNDIGDNGVTILCEGLEQTKHVPQTLALSACDLGSRGFKSLAKLLSLSAWCAGLQVLDVSDNSMGKSGTDNITTWLSSPSLALEQCIVARTDCDLERLFATLKSNPRLVNGSLSLLDISGNKLTKKSVPDLCHLLAHSRCLSCICMSDCHVETKFALDILDSVIRNNHNIGFSLDLSKNDISPKGARDIQLLLSDRVSRDPKPLMEYGVIQFLDLSDNNLGNEGLATVCKSLQGTAIKGLKLDHNFKPGMFTKATEASEALANFISYTPGLQELSIAGDDNNYYLSKWLNPLLAAVSGHPSLVFLDVQKNRIGDEGVCILADSLTANKTLVGFNMDYSRMSLIGLQALHKGLEHNKSVYDMTMPISDLDKILKSVNQDKVGEVQSIIHALDMVMDANEQALFPSQQPDDDEDDFKVSADLLASLAPKRESTGANPSFVVPSVVVVPGVGTIPVSQEGAPVVETMSMDAFDHVVPSNTDTKARGSFLMRGGVQPAPLVGGHRQSVASRGHRMSVAAGSYDDMMAGLKSTKTHRKMVTRSLDTNVSHLQHINEDNNNINSVSSLSQGLGGLQLETHNEGNEDETSPSSSSSGTSYSYSQTPSNNMNSNTNYTNSAPTPTPPPLPPTAPVGPPPLNNPSSPPPVVKPPPMPTGNQPPRRVNIHIAKNVNIAGFTPPSQ